MSKWTVKTSFTSAGFCSRMCNAITCPVGVVVARSLVESQVTRLGCSHKGRRTSNEQDNESTQCCVVIEGSSPFHQGVYHFPSRCRKGILALGGKRVHHFESHDPFIAFDHLKIGVGFRWIYYNSYLVFVFPINGTVNPAVSLFVIPLSWVSMEEPGGTSRSNLGSGGNGGVHVSQEPSLKVGVVLSDERVDFLREQAFCVLRVKTDKWNRFIGTEENQKMILDFLDHIWTDKLLLYSGPGGTLHAGNAQV